MIQSGQNPDASSVNVGNESDRTEPDARPSNKVIGITAFVTGGIIIAVLTRYNSAGLSAYSTGGSRGFYPWDEYLTINLTGLMLAPLMLIFGFFKRRADEFGLRPSEPGTARIVVICYAAMLPVLLIFSRNPAFQHQYPMDYRAAYSIANLITFELVYGFYFLCWEFFYRGFLTFGLSHTMDYRLAILLQSIGFGIMHVGKPGLEMPASFVGGFALGVLAWRSRSFYPCFTLHWAISLTFDLLVLHAKPGGLI